jgi:thiol-disulfide isomerase/thioredoxin
MKKHLFILLAILLSGITLTAQEALIRKELPAVDLKTIFGEKVNTSEFSNNGKPIIIDFWATWCKPCIEELNAIHEVYADWQKETGVKLIAISVDDSRTAPRVAPFVNGKGWNYESYLDINSEFKRAMNVNMPPHTFILNGKGEVIWQHVGFAEGNEEEIYEVVKKLAAENPKN